MQGMSDVPDPPTASQARHIRRRLFERVADADTSHLCVAADAGEWQPFGRGVRIKVLHEADGVMSYLLRMEPGSCLPPHRHPEVEETLVVEGEIRVGTHAVEGPGSYQRAAVGSLHATTTTQTGALLFVRAASPSVEQVLG